MKPVNLKRQMSMRVSIRQFGLRLLMLAFIAMSGLISVACVAQETVPSAPAPAAVPLPANTAPAVDAAPTPAHPEENSGLKLGVGDAVSIQVYGRPELATTTYVSDDGAIAAPLAGSVHVSGLSPAEAAQRVADAYREGQILVNPQVTINVVQFRSQQVSVLGEVRNPGRYPIESKMTIFDLIAQAGGINENGADVIYLLRHDSDGNLIRSPIDFKGLSDPTKPIPTIAIRGGDSVFIPRAEQFYIYGQVQKPGMYRLEPSMTVIQAISLGGGITPSGSDSRIEIKRRHTDGKYTTFDAHLTDPVQVNDVIRVKERIF